jgi:uracil-DNA glycosylase
MNSKIEKKYFQEVNNEWKTIILNIFDKNNLKILEDLDTEYENYSVFPQASDIFKCFSFFKPSETIVVFVGQDPYHQKNIADGLCFSTRDTNKTPSSLQNIFKELYNDLGINQKNNDLSNWAKQGVLLLNSVLSVRENQTLSHHHLNWEVFTNSIIEYLSANYPEIIFVFFGKKAQIKNIYVKKQENILNLVHPSGLSAYRGFIGNKMFSEINKKLDSKKNIIW